MAIELGSIFAFLKLDTRQFEAGLSGAAKTAEQHGAQIGKVLAAAGLAFSAVAVVEGVKKVVAAASDLSETMNKVNVVFGTSAAAVNAFAAKSATALGMTKNEALTAAGTYGNLFRSMGMAEDASATMSTGLVQLAADLASFNNQDPALVLDKLRAGLTGESEPLKSLGVNINEDIIKMKAMEMGLYNGKGAITALAKAQASYALIMQQTNLAQGDFSRTSDGLANRQRILAAQFGNVQATLGTALLPAVNALGGAFINLLQKMTPIIEAGSKFVEMNLAPVLIALAAVIMALVVPALLSAAAAATAAAIAAAPIVVPILAIAAAAVVLTKRFNDAKAAVDANTESIKRFNGEAGKGQNMSLAPGAAGGPVTIGTQWGGVGDQSAPFSSFDKRNTVLTSLKAAGTAFNPSDWLAADQAEAKAGADLLALGRAADLATAAQERLKVAAGAAAQAFLGGIGSFKSALDDLNKPRGAAPYDALDFKGKQNDIEKLKAKLPTLQEQYARIAGTSTAKEFNWKFPDPTKLAELQAEIDDTNIAIEQGTQDMGKMTDANNTWGNQGVSAVQKVKDAFKEMVAGQITSWQMSGSITDDTADAWRKATGVVQTDEEKAAMNMQRIMKLVENDGPAVQQSVTSSLSGIMSGYDGNASTLNDKLKGYWDDLIKKAKEYGSVVAGLPGGPGSPGGGWGASGNASGDYDQKKHKEGDSAGQGMVYHWNGTQWIYIPDPKLATGQGTSLAGGIDAVITRATHFIVGDRPGGERMFVGPPGSQPAGGKAGTTITNHITVNAVGKPAPAAISQALRVGHALGIWSPQGATR